jgi:mRNA interferase MazF
MKRGDVWWVEFDPALGSEIKKTRPAILVSNDSANRHLTRVIVVPLTSNTEHLYPGEAFITLSGKPSKAMVDQIMTVDKKRLKTKIDTLSKSDLRDVEAAILVQLGLPK